MHVVDFSITVVFFAIFIKWYDSSSSSSDEVLIISTYTVISYSVKNLVIGLTGIISLNKKMLPVLIIHCYLELFHTNCSFLGANITKI